MFIVSIGKVSPQGFCVQGFDSRSCLRQKDHPNVGLIQVEDTDMELPKIYEPIESFKALEERLKYFLDQYNDIIRGSDMDLVFFPDAVIHLIKISRVIRNPGGNMMLVGVGGSGKLFRVL